MSTQTSLVTGVDFVSVPTQDLDAAMDFYGDVLGLQRSKMWQRSERTRSAPSSRPAP